METHALMNEQSITADNPCIMTVNHPLGSEQAL